MTLDQVIAYVCVLAIVIIGALILRFTEAGLSVRAMVDSEAMTSLSGSNPSRIAAGVWVVSTFLAGLAGILAAPVIGLDSGKFTLLIAAAFAAVIAARLRSLPVAVIVALLMGIAGSLVQYYLPPDSDVTANIIPSIPFVFVVDLPGRQHHPQRPGQRGGRGGWCARPGDHPERRRPARGVDRQREPLPEAQLLLPDRRCSPASACSP